ncbi:crotonobetainyl-CoA:carnitine CoA-transferase CaiB-like acyl-CoA transferase [Palleronia aestuarii]|uniref:Crotonobetainyl-CoA:carnitine CoA-transferase CaiB-like acyl-CoA transferase n=1 Tax=Palleronia aestuarii TaxID=568105 RepID=A0A2W7MYK4_9RHOB|nr:CoA transferase [Palleronia aestuarii]PZX13028.1 crotonobetainyl-CoA:carnitine CoA-transferase CaiB-like acyl-CoA transferase [Palleronia aestuarii]
MSQKLPLTGITVIDFGQIYNGPYASFLMAMAGARVIKIEPPQGENMRRRGAVGGAMIPFAMLNSNKEFVTLNLKTEEGLSLARQMIARADVVLENFAPGVMERLGLGHELLLSLNPKLIYAAGTGYGWSGPYRDFPAMDLTVQAMSGIMSTTGFPDRPPVKAGPAVADFFGGVHLYGAVVTALYEREQTGRGRRVEVSMLDSVYASLASALGLYFGGKDVPSRTGNRHSGMAEAPYNVYPAKDGYLALICVSERHWTSLLSALGREDLNEDPRLGSLAARVENIEFVDETIAAFTQQFTRAELYERLKAHRVPCAPVRDLDEVVHDPHLHERGMLRHVHHPLLGDLVLPASPMRYDGEAIEDLRPSKSLGADNEYVYRDWLGLSQDEFAAYGSKGVF